MLLMRPSLIYLFSLFVAVPVVSSASDRVALIVGNNAYKHATPLKTAVNDAKDIWDKLTEHGFDAGTKPLLNGTLQELVDEVELFKERARTASVALVYFAGHGIEYSGVNYLIPTDATLEKATQLKTQAYSLGNMLLEIKSLKIPVRLIILDCCRNNPLPDRSWSRGDQTFADVSDEALGGATMVVFSAAPGTKAHDRINQLDRNSPFAGSLLKQLSLPEMGLFNLFAEVENDVFVSTGESQKPKLRFNGDISPFATFVLNKRTDGSPQPMVMKTSSSTTLTTKAPDEPNIGFKAGANAGEVMSVDIGDNVPVRFVWCPPGEFRRDLTSRIRLTKGFWIAKTECTRRQYRTVINGPLVTEKEANLPVDGISWVLADDYCRSLTDKLHESKVLGGKWIVALPTEAQWEYACRATWESPYSVGDGHRLTSKDANFRFTDSFEYSYSGKPKQVGSYSGNFWGIQDMHGNVWEHCADWFGPHANHDLIDPVGAKYGTNTGHVCRGGSWYNPAERCRSDTRTNSDENPAQPIDSVAGFRCVIVHDDSSINRN